VIAVSLINLILLTKDIYINEDLR